MNSEFPVCSGLIIMLTFVFIAGLFSAASILTLPYCFHFLTLISLCHSSYVWALNNLHYNFLLSPVVNFYYLVLFWLLRYECGSPLFVLDRFITISCPFFHFISFSSPNLVVQLAGNMLWNL